VEALECLKAAGYDGHVFVPEARGGLWAEEYDDQIAWETKFLKAADVILFWLPRDLHGSKKEGNGSPMPGLTTNDEWGVWKDSGKVVLGCPEWADKVRYQKHSAEELQVPQASTLQATVDLALKKVGAGAPRSGPWDPQVPHFIWTRQDFQLWYQSQVQAGNIVKDVDVKQTFWVGKNKDHLFLYILQPTVHITEEGRDKVIECVIFRPDISTVCLYKRMGSDLTATKIVLVREFRTAVRNEGGLVYELPGGSSSEDGKNPLQAAVDEVSEELGLRINPARLKSHGSRQMGATLVSYHSHLYSVELTEEELAKLEADTSVHGEDGEERITIHVKPLADILAENLVDWPMLGMIFGSFT
jgi:8-oxo-dGTP pyrophosphatase MutT (NUDIX family)